MKPFFLSLMLGAFCQLGFSQQRPTNYDESAIPAYTLPSLLVSPDGKIIKNKEQWERIQRPFILKTFAREVYGSVPGKPRNLHFKLTETDPNALEGTAIRKQVTIYFSAGFDAPHMDLLVYLPKTDKKVPVFVALNFQGNQTINKDPGILTPQNILKSNPKLSDNEAVAQSRGATSSRWPLSEIIKNGFGVATAHYYDLEPDNADGWKTGIRTTLMKELDMPPTSWSAIAAWAWGLSRVQDYLETDKNVDAKHTILLGHSRLGKTALWAGATDPRFSIIISNNSGEGGAALSRRNFGETIADLNRSFPHWFVDKYKSYNQHPEELPVDQHMLLALIAPRPLYVASAAEDRWADPKGEFLAAKNAEPVYRLYHLKGLGVTDMPGIDTPVGETIRYHIRSGKHDITAYDWKQYIEFAKLHLKK